MFLLRKRSAIVLQNTAFPPHLDKEKGVSP